MEVKAVAFMSGGFSNEPTHTKTSRESNTLSTFVTVGFGSPSGVTSWFWRLGVKSMKANSCLLPKSKNKEKNPTGYINRIVSQCFRSMKFSSRIYYALNRNALRKHDCSTHRGLATGVGQPTRTALTGTITLQPYALGSCAKLPQSTSWLFLNLNLWSGTTCHTKWVFPAYATIDWWNKYSRPHPGQARRLRPFYIIFWCIMNRNVNSKIFHQLEKNSTHVSFG